MPYTINTLLISLLVHFAKHQEQSKSLKKCILRERKESSGRPFEDIQEFDY